MRNIDLKLFMFLLVCCGIMSVAQVATAQDSLYDKTEKLIYIKPITPPPVNQPPIVALTILTTYPAGPVALTANASDPDGTITKVEFLVNGTKVGEDLTSPYAYTHTFAAGSFSVTAKATDNKGATGVSPAVTVTITAPDPTTIVDNVDSKIVYTPTWEHNGPTNAPGFYPAAPNSTMAYSQTAANTSTLIFTGTYFEAFCEKKVGHGSATFQIDNQTPVTVNLGVEGPTGSTSVFKVTNLSNTQHTFKLTVVGGGYVVFDYVKIIGTTVTPPNPIPPGGSIVVNPGQSIKNAVESAPANSTVSIMTGTYNEPNMNVPLTVKIIGVGQVTVVATTPGISGNAEQGLFQFSSAVGTVSNNVIENLTLEGNNVAYGGIYINGRNKVVVKNVKVRNFNFHGIWIKSSADSEITGCDLYNTGWGSTGYTSGQLVIFALTRVLIENNVFRSDKDLKGTGIEALWKESVMTDLKILRNTFALIHLNPWNNYQARNFSIEIHDTHYNGIEIAYNNFGNQLSMASHKPATPQTPGKTLIHHNTGNLGGDTMFIENVCDNLDAYDNTVTNALMFAANFQPNSVWKNNNFYRNTFTSSGAVSWGGMFLIGPLGVQNFTITNNTFGLNGNVKIKYMGTTGGVTESGNTWYPGTIPTVEDTSAETRDKIMIALLILIILGIAYLIWRRRNQPN